MKIHGTLTKWNDDRGFGFVQLPKTHEEIFVHISAFPRDGTRPHIGEIISFNVRIGPDGKKRAEGIVRPRAQAATARSRHASTGQPHNLFRMVGNFAIVGVLGFAGYNLYEKNRDNFSEPVFPASDTIEFSNQQFSCDGRTQCPQMTSCEEAIYFLQNCPSTQMDGDNDGEPCEQEWCSSTRF